MEITNISSELDECENSNEKRKCKVSKFRNYSSQIYAASATNIVKFASGSSAGFTAVLIAELYKDDAEINMSLSDLSWFGSNCFMTPIGCLALGLLSQRIGTRSTMLISMIFFAISFLMFHFATTSNMLLGAQIIGGLFFMISVGPALNYVVEISQPQLRSTLTASTMLVAMSAQFSVVLLSNFLHWRMIVLVMLVFSVIGFLAVCTIPESPHWLASKNKFQEAQSSLSWLRGWSSPENVVSEFNALKENYTKTPNSINIEHLSRLSQFKSHINAYSRRSFYIPLSLTCLLFILHHCTGYGAMLTYCIVIFRQINTPIDPHVAASIFDAMRIFGALVCILTIHYAGKKKLMYISLIGATLTFFSASTALMLKEHEIQPEICQWVAAISMMLTTFLTSTGIDKVVYILNAELFPTKYRNVGTGIGLFTTSIGWATMNKIFLPLMAAVTLPGVFLIFGISCIVACTMFHFMFPETEGKTLQEIEEHYEGIRKKEANSQVGESNERCKLIELENLSKKIFHE